MLWDSLVGVGLGQSGFDGDGGKSREGLDMADL